MSESEVSDESYAREEARLRRNAWILAAVSVALIPLIYLLMVKVLLPYFWIEEADTAADVEVSELGVQQRLTADPVTTDWPTTNQADDEP